MTDLLAHRYRLARKPGEGVIGAMRAPALWLGLALEITIRAYVRLVGRRVAIADHAWLAGPIGVPGRGGALFYEDYAATAGLHLVTDDPRAGLLPNFNALAGPHFDPAAIDPKVRDFYEHTAAYSLDAWAQWNWPFGIFAWILIALVSRRIDQINLPLAPLDTSHGMTSEVIGLVDGSGQRVDFTGWFRRIRGSGRTIYAGFYTTATPPRAAGPCVKVVFPLPHGSATVLLRPDAQPDGSLKLISQGRGFGDPGFYRVLRRDDQTLLARQIPAMHELIHVYVDGDGTLRTDHSFSFFNLPMLRLHYRMTPRAN